MDQSSIDESAEAIAREIGLDLSYLTSEEELHFDPITITVAAGLLLLKWFLDGIADSLHERVEAAGKDVTDRLAEQLTDLFATSRAPTDDEICATVDAVRGAAQDQHEAKLVETAQLNEQKLAEYLVDQGMPRDAALRIADRVRLEAMRQMNEVQET